LTTYKTVAIVGLSKNPAKASHEVAQYLKSHGFHIVPINPFADEILGERSYKTLLDLPDEIQKTIEVVDIFRPSEDVPAIVDQAITLKNLFDKLNVIWMQLGIINEQAAEKAQGVGLTVVMGKCMMREHKRILCTPGD
jgi:predicted CoA-binding protein